MTFAKGNYFIARPEQIKISLTNQCNFRCVMCANPRLEQERGFISDELLYKILDECAREGITKISLGGTGEPLLHPNFIAYLLRAKQLAMWVSTTTNISRLTPDLSAALLDAGLDRIHLSLYSSSAQEHREYTGTKTFDLIETNLKCFLQAWSQGGRKTEIGFSFLDLPGVNDRTAFFAQWEPLLACYGLGIYLRNHINWGGRPTPSAGEAPEALGQQIPCPHIRYYLHVLHNGDVVPCCNIMEVRSNHEICFGNATKQTLMQIWNGDAYRKFKQAHACLATCAYPLCANCSDVLVRRSGLLTRIAAKARSLRELLVNS